MKKKFFWRISALALATVLSVMFFLPTTSLKSSMPEWLQGYGIVLGLDLQGGVHLVYEVDSDKAVEVTMERMASSLTNTFKEEKIEAKAVKSNSDIVVSPADEKALSLVAKEFPALKLENKSAEEAVFRIDNAEVARIKDLAVDQALETIRNRVDEFGVAEPTIHRQAENEIVIQLPGVKDTGRAIDLVGRPLYLNLNSLMKNPHWQHSSRALSFPVKKMRSWKNSAAWCPKVTRSFLVNNTTRRPGPRPREYI